MANHPYCRRKQSWRESKVFQNTDLRMVCDVRIHACFLRQFFYSFSDRFIRFLHYYQRILLITRLIIHVTLENSLAERTGYGCKSDVNLLPFQHQWFFYYFQDTFFPPFFLFFYLSICRLRFLYSVFCLLVFSFPVSVVLLILSGLVACGMWQKRFAVCREGVRVIIDEGDNRRKEGTGRDRERQRKTGRDRRVKREVSNV